MGKVKDGVPASKATKPSKGVASAVLNSRFAQFLVNLVRTDLYKPKQGWYARVYTAAGLGLILGVGLYRFGEGLTEATTPVRFGVPTLVGVALAWFVYRLVQFPPFVEFLIATEAEMNKVSWTSKDDLYRATTVVLVTVTLMALFLFGVDWVWANLLQFLGVLRLGGGGAFGSTAG